MSEIENEEIIEETQNTEDTENTDESEEELLEQSKLENEFINNEQQRLLQEQQEQERLLQEQQEKTLELQQEQQEQERLQAIQEHEEYLNSFPETTVFYKEIVTRSDGSKALGTPIKNARLAESWGILENHYDESELTYVGTDKCGIWYLKGHEAQELTLAELKARKLAELSNITDKFEQNKCSEMYFTSSLGFRVNGDRRSVQNIESLITIGEPTRFKDYDDNFHPDFTVAVPDFSVEKLNILKLEIAKNSENLYQQKFLYEYRIQTATTPEELNFDMVFEMSDFSA